MKPDVKKIIADIKATKGNRKFCNGLAGTLQDDNYASSICKYVKTVTPERIDLLIEYAEKLEAEVTDMAVQLANAESKCRELAAENEKQLTHSEALAVDNAALREVVERMVNQFAMSGISPEEKSINPAKSLMFDAKSALFMPATDAFLAEVRAQGVEALVLRRKTAARIARERDDLRAADALEGEACRAQMFADEIRQGGAA